MTCLQCDPYRPGSEDVTSTTPEDAATFERERAQARAELLDERPEPEDYR